VGGIDRTEGLTVQRYAKFSGKPSKVKLIYANRADFADTPALAHRSPALYLASMTLKEKIQKYFRRRHADETAEQQPSATPQPLRIEGVKPAPLTPEPDDAELAAQALLESMCDGRSKMEDVRGSAADAHQSIPADAPTRSLSAISHQPSVRDAAYYRRLAERIRLARDLATLRTMRFVTWCEHELEKRDLPIEGKGSLAQMEAELYKRIDTIERVGGELKHRWQHCLATVTVRLMQAEGGVVESDGQPTPNDTL